MQMKIIAQACTLKESFDMKRSTTSIAGSYLSHSKSIVTLVWRHHHLSVLTSSLCLLECTWCKVHIMEIRFIHWKSTCSTETMIELWIVPDKVEPLALRSARAVFFLAEETSCYCCIHWSTLNRRLVNLGSESDMFGSATQGLRIDWPSSRMHNWLRRHRWLLYHLFFGSVLMNYWRMI